MKGFSCNMFFPQFQNQYNMLICALVASYKTIRDNEKQQSKQTFNPISSDVVEAKQAKLI